ncbi:MAG: GtrA family protein [Clostridia bacterium]|nr:GtrA family protein [Clostridia bacterium]
MKSEKMTEFLRVVKFTLVSISAAIIQLGSYALMEELLLWPYWPCYLISLVLSVVWNLTVNRKITFRSETNYTLALIKVLLFYAVFTPVTTILGNWLVESMGWNGYVVTILNMLFNFVTEFLYQRFFVFRNSLDSIPQTEEKE